jgi:hypothetical protein
MLTKRLRGRTIQDVLLQHKILEECTASSLICEGCRKFTWTVDQYCHQVSKHAQELKSRRSAGIATGDGTPSSCGVCYLDTGRRTKPSSECRSFKTLLRAGTPLLSVLQMLQVPLDDQWPSFDTPVCDACFGIVQSAEPFLLPARDAVDLLVLRREEGLKNLKLKRPSGRGDKVRVAHSADKAADHKVCNFLCHLSTTLYVPIT